MQVTCTITVGGTLPPADYTVTNDSELTTVLANNDATLSGKIIHFEAGTYTAPNLSGRTFSPRLTLRSPTRDVSYQAGYRASAETIPNRSGTARLSGTTDISSATGINFNNLEFYKADGGGPTDEIIYAHEAEEITIQRCEIGSDQPAAYNLNAYGESLPRGLASGGGSAKPNTNFEILDCFLHDLHDCFDMSWHTGCKASRNVVRDIYLNIFYVRRSHTYNGGATDYGTFELNSNVCIGNYHSTIEDNSIHSAQFGFDTVAQNCSIEGNVILPVYERCGAGAPDLDKQDHRGGNRICGNIVVSRQNSGLGIQGMDNDRVIGNTNVALLNASGAPNADNTVGPVPRALGTHVGGSIIAHNLTMGEASGPLWGIGGVYFAGGDPGASVIKREANLGLGHSGTMGTDGTGVINDDANGAVAGITINSQNQQTTFDEIFDGVNANADFYQIEDPTVLATKASHETKWGDWCGALGHGYVTLQPGKTWADQLVDPEDVIIDTNMEPTAP